MVSLALNGGSRKRQKIRKLTVVGGLEVEDDDSGEDVKNVSFSCKLLLLGNRPEVSNVNN